MILISGAPLSGKTELLRQMAVSIQENNPDIHLSVLLLGGRAEDVPAMRRAVTRGEVTYSSEREDAENHVRAASAAVERAKRLVEMGEDVVVLINGLSLLAAACDEVAARRTFGLSFWVRAKALFGAGRNIEFGGSLTIIGTASDRMDADAACVLSEISTTVIRLTPSLVEASRFLRADCIPVIDTERSWSHHRELLVRPIIPQQARA